MVEIKKDDLGNTFILITSAFPNIRFDKIALLITSGEIHFPPNQLQTTNNTDIAFTVHNKYTVQERNNTIKSHLRCE